ncbi:MAG: SCO family protein [Leptothrix ochracea]|uniref:SCO family protein n=1 Tax=Leptothrix ochracea TaxID=735331 RepID=UPI0034E1C899
MSIESIQEPSLGGDLSRRAMMLGGSLALLLSGCDAKKAQPSFHGLNITGANYAQAFSLQDPEGKTRTLAEFKGKVVLLFFGFTQCPDVCPTALTRAALVKQILGPDADKLAVIFVTLDPERDTAALLKNYTAAFDPEFLGLRSSLADLPALAQAFKITYKKVPTGSSYTMDHTALSYVYDLKGHIRLAIRHDQPADQLARDVRELLNETTSS